MEKESKKWKIAYSICIYGSFLSIGWIRGLFGPSFIDLQFISDVNLQLGSWIATVNFTGYAIGCFAGGFLYDKVNRKLLYGAGVLGVGIVTAATPWCFIFALMAAMHFGQGFASGIVDTVGNTEMINLWQDNKMMYFIVELMYSSGVFIAPLIVAPFLSDIRNTTRQGLETTPLNSSLFSFDQTSISYSSVFVRDVNTSDISTIRVYTTDNSTSGNITWTAEGEGRISRIYIPYTITAGLAILLCIPFFVMYFIQKQDTIYSDVQTEVHAVHDDDLEKVTSGGNRSARQLPKNLLVISLLIISSLIILGVSAAEISVSYFAVYCVDELGFSPSDGALASSLAGICSLLSIVVALLASRANTLMLIGVYIIGNLLGAVVLLFSSIAHFDLGVWLSAGCIGFFRAMLFSLSFTWTNSYITPMSGKLTSMYMVGTCVGCAVLPVLLGWLMEEYSNLWFCYLILILLSLVLVLYIGGVVVTNYITSLYGKTYNKTKYHEISLTERLQRDTE